MALPGNWRNVLSYVLIFGLLAEVNIGKLLISGIIPAILVTMTIMARRNIWASAAIAVE